MLDTILNYGIVLLAGTILGILAMLARDAWDERMEDRYESEEA
jgi:hypothetical protein